MKATFSTYPEKYNYKKVHKIDSLKDKQFIIKLRTDLTYTRNLMNKIN